MNFYCAAFRKLNYTWGEMAKEQTPEWVTELISRALAKAESAADLAEIIKISPSNFVNYDAGTTPSIQIIERMLGYLGGDINLALPWSDPKKATATKRTVVYEEPEQLDFDMPASNTIFISGQVSAGKVSFAGEDQYAKPVESLWSESRYWGLTHGDLCYLEVNGDSMAPEYTNGEVIVCRMPVSPTDLPNGTPVIFQEGEEDSFTFKLLRRAEGGLIVGQPINPSYDMVVFKGSDVNISAVVLGKVHLEKKDMVHAVADTKPRKKTSKKQK